MKILPLLLAVTLLFAIAPANAKEASAAERLRLSVTVANFIRDERDEIARARRGSHSFGGSKAIEIGAAVIEQPYALADWRSADRKHHGHILFYYMCDGWNVGAVTDGEALGSKQLASMRFGGPSKPIASKLVGELATLEQGNVTYLKPSRASRAC